MPAGSRPVPSKGTRLLHAVFVIVGMVVFKLFIIPAMCAYLYYELCVYCACGNDRESTNGRQSKDSQKHSTRKRIPKRSAPNLQVADVALSSQPTDVQIDGTVKKKRECTAENTRRTLKKRAWSWPRKCVSDGSDSRGEKIIFRIP